MTKGWNAKHKGVRRAIETQRLLRSGGIQQKTAGKRRINFKDKECRNAVKGVEGVRERKGKFD